MADLTMTWSVHAGWADVRLADHAAEVTISASYVTAAPEHLLGAVTRLLRGDAEAGAEFEAEPTVYRWHLRRDGGVAYLRITEHPGHRRPGTEVWSTRQPLDVLARTLVRCFDALAPAEYEREWRRPFPHHELAGLRTAWREHQAAAP
ncbi:hypothetical protein [Lentzea sp. CA-135723]|uniref:hypothetical protein n=1 Tax=Lentzea sp. CA-135723 TaxID=3239950 RepID=UPI003D900037